MISMLYNNIIPKNFYKVKKWYLSNYIDTNTLNLFLLCLFVVGYPCRIIIPKIFYKVKNVPMNWAIYTLYPVIKIRRPSPTDPRAAKLRTC